MKVTITCVALKRCPFVEERDTGVLTIRIEGREGPELWELADWLSEFVDEKISHEDYTLAVAQHLEGFTGTVETSWRTAGLTMTCNALLGERL